MKKRLAHRLGLAAVMAALGWGSAWAQRPAQDGPVLAQASGSSGYGSAAGGSSFGYGTSWIPYTHSGYVGVAVGQGDLDTRCLSGLSCEKSDESFKVYTGGLINPMWGVELAYVQFGDADRNGGETKAKGANLSLVGVWPLTPMFNLTGKIGGTYSWTETSVGFLVPAPSGDDDGFGFSYGVGASFNFNPNWALTVDWERHRMHFAGDNREDADLATIGVKYSF